MNVHFRIANSRPASGDNVFPEDENGLMAMGDTHYLDTWLALEKVLKTGKVKAIGLSNFTKEQVQNIIDKGEVVGLPDRDNRVYD